MQQAKATVILLSLWTLLALLQIISTIEISWTKYVFEDASHGLSCASTEDLFVRGDGPDSFACSKIFFLHNKCLTTVYRPENFQCIKCSLFSYQTLENLKGSIQLSRRDFHIDCKDVLAKDKLATNGVYEIRLSNSEMIEVYCDMVTDGAGWTVFQEWFDQSVDFDMDFAAYEAGFGILAGEFWLGLRFVQELTNQPSELLSMNQHFSIANKLIVRKSPAEYEKYSHFKLLGENYVLCVEYQIDEPETGMVVESARTNYFLEFNASEFSTFGQDSGNRCAKLTGGGWWFHEYHNDSSCFVANLNVVNWNSSGMIDDDHFFKSTMMVRRR